MKVRHLILSAVLGGAWLPGAWAAGLIDGGDPRSLEPFAIRFKGAQAVKEEGNKHWQWAGNCWDAGSEGEVGLGTIDGEKAYYLRNLSGRASVQFYNWQEVALKGGCTYRLMMTYRTPASAEGVLVVRGKNVPERKVELKGAKDGWKTVQVEITPEQDGGLALLIQNYASGPENTLYLREMTLEMTKEGKPAPAAPAAAVQVGPVRPAVGPKLAESQDAFHQLVLQSLKEKGIDDPRLMISGGTENAMKVLSHFVLADKDARAKCETVSVEGQPFAKAYRIETSKPKIEWMTHIQGTGDQPVSKGDLIYITGMARVHKTLNEWGKGVVGMYMGKEEWRGSFMVGKEWSRFHLAMYASRDYAPGEFKLMFTFGDYAQTLEMGAITAVNVGGGQQMSRLPTAPLEMNYAGREEGAAWRKEALARIEQVRKADLAVTVVDAQGKPVPDAQVKVEMKKHAFFWGGGIPAGMLPGTNVKPWNDDFKRTAGASEKDKETIREKFLEMFNATTASVTWAVWSGGDQRISQSDITTGMQWYRDHGIAVLNSQVVYPGPEFAAPAWQGRISKEYSRILGGGEVDPKFAAEFAEAIKGIIFEHARVLKPLGLHSFQIANEFEGRPQYTAVLGGDPLDRITEWFRWAEEADPTILRQINHVDSNQYYYELVEGLLKRGAPIQAIGFQWHSGVGVPSPMDRYDALERFAKFGKKLEITEYEMTLPNGDDGEQRKYQADYTRDMIIMAFSHPAVHAFMLQDFWQPGAWQYTGNSAFYNADWSLNPHGKVWLDHVKGKWWTKETGKTDGAGQLAVRGYKGDYDVTVVQGDTTIIKRVRLGDGGAAVKLIMQ